MKSTGTAPFGDSNVIELGEEVPQYLSFSPDGRQFAFLGTGGIESRNFRVAIAVDGMPRSLTPPSLDASSYAWMPDSESILVASRQGDHDSFVVFDLSGKQLRRIDVDRQLRAEETGMSVRLDGKLAIFGAGAGVRASSSRPYSD